MLPQIVKESIFKKIKKWFLKIFEKSNDSTNAIESLKKVEKSNFKSEIQIENNSILLLQNKLENKKIEISDLTDQELDEMINLYKQQIEEKKNIIKQYRRLLVANKKLQEN